MFSSIGIQKDFVFFNHSPGYERSREIPIGNSFQIILFGIAVFFNVFSPPPAPLFLSFRSLRSLFFIFIKREGGGKDIKYWQNPRNVLCWIRPKYVAMAKDLKKPFHSGLKLDVRIFASSLLKFPDIRESQSKLASLPQPLKTSLCLRKIAISHYTRKERQKKCEWKAQYNNFYGEPSQWLYAKLTQKIKPVRTGFNM